MLKKLNIKWIILSVIVVLSFPLIGMFYTSKVKWSLTDFIVVGSLLFVTGLSIEIIRKYVDSKPNKIAVISITILVLLVVWAELSVGLIGSLLAGN